MATEETDKIEKVIDIDKILEGKAPKLKRWMPGFLVRYLKKIAHGDDLNLFFPFVWTSARSGLCGCHSQAFPHHYQHRGARRTCRTMAVSFSLPTMRLAALMAWASCTFCAHYPEVKSPVNDLLMNVQQLTPFFIPVNKLGCQTKESASELYDYYASSDTILFFPAGVCSRRQLITRFATWVEKDFHLQGGTIKRDVVPVHFIGQNSKFFYNLGYWRKSWA